MDKLKIIEEAHPHFCEMRKAKIAIYTILAIMSLPVVWTLFCFLQGQYPDKIVFVVATAIFVLCSPVAVVSAKRYDRHNLFVEKIIEKHIEEEKNKGEKS